MGRRKNSMKHIRIEGLKRIILHCISQGCDRCRILSNDYKIYNTAPACWTEKEINIILKAVREQQ